MFYEHLFLMVTPVLLPAPFADEEIDLKGLNQDLSTITRLVRLIYKLVNIMKLSRIRNILTRLKSLPMLANWHYVSDRLG